MTWKWAATERSGTMHRTSRMHLPAPRSRLFSLLTLAALALSVSARAQPRDDVSTVRFRPAIGPGNYIALEGAEIPPKRATSYGLALDYARDTLVSARPCAAIANVARCEPGEIALVEQTALVHLLASVGVGRDTQLSFGLPLGVNDTKPLAYWIAQPPMPSAYRELRPKNGFVLGDLRLSAKRALYRDAHDRLRVAAVLFTTVPTGRLTSESGCTRGEHCTFIGERTVQAGGQAIVEFVASRSLRASAMLGAHYRPRRKVLDRQVGSELDYGAAIAYEPLQHLALKAELQGTLELRAEDVPLEARGAVAYGRDVVVTAGAGAGVVGHVGNPLFRLFAGVQWTPTFRDADGDGFEDDDDGCPQQAEDRDGHQDGDGCPESDNDGDGIPDTVDACDAEQEDRDGYRDEDGCPELDNDEDGVPDGYDTCEGQKEDRDGDRDDDGCPDLDRDRDGVVDEQDRCPDQAEDTDGLADEDGCAESDFDQDGFDDQKDACPEEPGPNTGAQGDDGCPA